MRKPGPSGRVFCCAPHSEERGTRVSNYEAQLDGPSFETRLTPLLRMKKALARFLLSSGDRAQHRLARPAIHLQSGALLVGAERRARLHAGLAVDLVVVEADARQSALHGFDVLGAQLRRGRPWRCKSKRTHHAVGEVADE